MAISRMVSRYCGTFRESQRDASEGGPVVPAAEVVEVTPGHVEVAVELRSRRIAEESPRIGGGERRAVHVGVGVIRRRDVSGPRYGPELKASDGGVVGPGIVLESS